MILQVRRVKSKGSRRRWRSRLSWSTATSSLTVVGGRQLTQSISDFIKGWPSRCRCSPGCLVSFAQSWPGEAAFRVAVRKSRPTAISEKA